MLSFLTRTIEKVLLQQINEMYGVSYQRLSFSVPPKIELGELALPIAFDLAKKTRRLPRVIAEELASRAAAIPGIWKADVAGAGYLNFHLDRGALAQKLWRSIEEKLYGRAPDPETPGKIIVEHTNINPNKAAHIGHLRNASMGDSFVRCLRFLGHKVEVQNYLDNTGVQVADVVVGFERMLGLRLPEVAAIEGKFDYYCWDVYSQVAEFYRQSEANLKWRSQTLQAIEAGDNPTAELAQHVAMRIVAAHLETMARINVRYDLLPRESEILHLHFWEKAFQLLKERGAIYFVTEGKNRGCWVMKVGDRDASAATCAREEIEDDEKIIVRSDQTVTYVGKDIAYQLWKFGLLGLDFHYELFRKDGEHELWITSGTETNPGTPPPRFGGGWRVYNVIDSRQSYLQSVVLQGLNALGFHEQAGNSIHFSYEMVALTPATCEDLGFELSEEEKKRPYVEVSGRKGLGVKADDLIDALITKALAEVRSRHEMNDDEAAQIARIIAVGALRYFLLRFARTTVIAFDFREALSFDGETGPYVQYAVVRANNIFRKLEESGVDPYDPSAQDTSSLNEFLAANDDIWEMVYQAARLAEVVRQIAPTLELAQLAKYAFSLAQRFNLFYHKYHILSEPDLQRKQHLLFAADLVRRQLGKALDLLGCEIPAKM